MRRKLRAQSPTQNLWKQHTTIRGERDFKFTMSTCFIFKLVSLERFGENLVRRDVRQRGVWKCHWIAGSNERSNDAHTVTFTGSLQGCRAIIKPVDKCRLPWEPLWSPRVPCKWHRRAWWLVYEACHVKHKQLEPHQNADMSEYIIED